MLADGGLTPLPDTAFVGHSMDESLYSEELTDSTVALSILTVRLL
jgi:hypothetical protein